MRTSHSIDVAHDALFESAKRTVGQAITSTLDAVMDVPSQTDDAKAYLAGVESALEVALADIRSSATYLADICRDANKRNSNGEMKP